LNLDPFLVGKIIDSFFGFEIRNDLSRAGGPEFSSLRVESIYILRHPFLSRPRSAAGAQEHQIFGCIFILDLRVEFHFLAMLFEVFVKVALAAPSVPVATTIVDEGWYIIVQGWGRV